MWPTKAALLFLILLASTSADLGNDSSKVCKFSYFFIIDHLEEGNILEYDQEDLLFLRGELEEIEVNVSIPDLEPFIENYTTNCPNSTSIPLPLEINETEETNQTDEYKCERISINKTIIDFYEMDWSLPILTIHKGAESCSKISFWKWFVNYEKTGQFDYSVTGVKIWWIIPIVIIIPIALYLRFHILLRRTTKEEVDLYR